MPFDWTLYLGVAKALASQAGDEAALRSAISRAYYAAFGLAAARARTEGGAVPRTGEAHAEVWKHFESANDQYRRKIGQDGKRLRWRRRQADYDEAVRISTGDVTDSIRRADSIIRFIGLLRP